MMGRDGLVGEGIIEVGSGLRGGCVDISPVVLWLLGTRFRDLGEVYRPDRVPPIRQTPLSEGHALPNCSCLKLGV